MKYLLFFERNWRKLSNNYPKIYLAVDNCIAAKRWCEPEEWMKLINSLGIKYVEASADNECDPLYMDISYLKDWVKQIKKLSKIYDISVSNFYSGHGTYTTLGLAHHDKRVRKHFINNWVFPLINMASELEADVGFYCHAFSEKMLSNKEEYSASKQILYDNLSIVANYAEDKGVQIGVEQMYSPHQIPWTIDGSHELMKNVYSNGAPMYITLDTGHQSGQHKFLPPSVVSLLNSPEQNNSQWKGYADCLEWKNQYLDAEISYQQFEKNVKESIDLHSYLFSSKSDSDTYKWFESLAAYSPIIHLQQTDGKSSAHLPFTDECNESGVIKGYELLKAIEQSYINDQKTGIPPKCDKLYLTLELFGGTADYPSTIISKLKSSVAYWRKFIPEDGLRLDYLLELADKKPILMNKRSYRT